jgi:hypothetical protein
MKRFILLLTVMLVTFSTQAQGFYSFFSFNEDEETFLTTWVDPTFDDGGFQVGIDITKELECGWVRIGVSHYEYLNPSYTDIVGSGGVNFHLFYTDVIKYSLGSRLGVEFREGNPFAIIGFVGGFEVKITDVIRVGFDVWKDYRASQDPSKYGAKGESQWVDNGSIRLIFRIND